MAGERIQFVSTISDTATIRMDLNAGPWAVLQNGTDVSPPAFTRSVVSTLLTDGDAIPASAYGNRIVKLHLQLRSPYPETNAAQLQKLWRELDRQTNILRWQPDPAMAPVFFRTFRSPDFEPTVFDHGLDLFDFTVNLVAEPFAYGLLVTGSTVSVQSDPSVTNGKYLDVTNVQGDVETPAIFRFLGTDVDTSALLPWQMVLGMRRRGTPSAFGFVVQAETATLGVDTTATASGTSYSPSGAGTNAATISFATTATATFRVSFYYPTTSNLDFRGTYRVFAKVSAPATGTFTLSLTHGVRTTSNDAVTISYNPAFDGHVDLGLLQFPEGADPVGVGYGPDGIPAPILTRLVAARTAGSGSLVVDYLSFVPADDALTLLSFKRNSPIPQYYVFDGIKKMVYGVDLFGQIADITDAYYVGGEQLLQPNQTNRIYILRSLGGNGLVGAVSDSATAKVDVIVSYYPRYLYVRPTGS